MAGKFKSNGEVDPSADAKFRRAHREKIDQAVSAVERNYERMRDEVGERMTKDGPRR